MKYMIMMYGSQQDYDMLTGKPTDSPTWSPEDMAALHAFMESWNGDLVKSGEFIDARGLSAPVHARRIQLQNGVPVVTDGPYAETQEVLAGYWIVDCESFDRATAIAGRLSSAPGPTGASAPVADVRPIVECDSFDRATEITARLANTPHPEHATLSHEWYVDVRPILEGIGDLEA